MLVPLPGLGIVFVLFMLLLLSAVSKFVSTSPTPPAAPHGLLPEVAQTLLLEYISINWKFGEADVQPETKLVVRLISLVRPMA